MSSFALMTRDGVPEVSVEIGKKFSKDTVMLSALFNAINTFSNEVIGDGIQLLQISGFTIKFMNINAGEWILIVGADKNVSNLNNLLEKISIVVQNGFQKQVSYKVIESQITEMLTDNLENDTNSQTVNFLIEEVFTELNDNVLRIMLWAMLTGNHIRDPKTRSLDFNSYVITFLEYFSEKPCDGSDNCKDFITFVDKKGNFIFNGKEYTAKKNFIYKTKLLKKLIKMGNEHKFNDLFVYFLSTKETIKQLISLCDRSDISDRELKDLNLTRHMIGMEMEYYFLEGLKTVNPNKYELLRSNTDELEWLTEWKM